MLYLGEWIRSTPRLASSRQSWESVSGKALSPGLPKTQVFSTSVPLTHRARSPAVGSCPGHCTGLGSIPSLYRPGANSTPSHNCLQSLPISWGTGHEDGPQLRTAAAHTDLKSPGLSRQAPYCAKDTKIRNTCTSSLCSVWRTGC